MKECIWKFETADWRVLLQVEPCEDYPDWHDTQAESERWQRDIDAGNLVYFNAWVTVIHKPSGHDFGTDVLCACEYHSYQEFISGHRDPDPMARNSSVMRAARGGNVVICHYFPGMVRVAIDEARKTARAFKRIGLRAA